MDESDRLKLLGKGGAGKAGAAISGRGKQLDDAERRAVHGTPAAAPAAEAATPPGGGVRFEKGWTPEERARQQEKLAEMMRKDARR